MHLCLIFCQRATKENNEEPSQVEVFITTRISNKGKSMNPESSNKIVLKKKEKKFNGFYDTFLLYNSFVINLLTFSI